MKRVLITGATGGIGRTLVSEFLNRGWFVGIQFRSDEVEAKRLLALAPDRTSLHRADLSQEGEVEAMFSGTPFDTLVANAGKYESRSCGLHEMSLEQWDRTFQNNTRSACLCLKHFLKQQAVTRPSECAVVLLGSTAGEFGEAFHADYSASKAALKGLMLSAKNEIARICPSGRINMVSPSWTLTPMARDFLSNPSAIAWSLQTKSIRKLVRADDVAKAVAFLADSALSGQITGHNLMVTGGIEGRVLWAPEELDVSSV
jgi:NAD(P)-dependent dehydrogenase (short-subunit alcohol dehydrogenase family)